MKLNVSPDLSLPLDVASQAVAVLGIRGAGKTNTATVIAEELLSKGQPMVYIDPTDAAWGLRSDFPVFIFGGTHGDLPLQETDGKTLAEFVVTEQVPVILSLRHLRKNAQRRFVTDFCEEIYHLKGKPENRTPLTVFIDEAPLFVPQKVMGDNARTVGAVEDLIARGRNAGFGVVLISQRSATINKDVLTQCDTIITHRLTSPQDRKALSDWIEENATIEKQKEVLQSLATMPNGRAWVWSPRLDVMKQVQIRLRKTFDSSATPKRGETPPKPKRLEDIDLGKLKGKLAAAIEQAERDDPRRLRAENAELRIKCADLERRSEPVADPLVVESAHRKGKIAGYAEAINALQPMVDRMRTLRTALDEQLGDLIEDLAKWRARHENLGVESAKSSQIIAENIPSAPAPRTATRRVQFESSGGNGALSKAERLILTALAQYPHGRTKNQVAILTGYAVNGGGFGNAISSLRTKGYLEGDAARLVITHGGIAALGSFDPLPRGRALLEHWMRQLSKAERKALETLAEVYPRSLSKAQLANRAGYEANGGGFNNALSRLRTLELIAGRAELKASAELFS